MDLFVLISIADHPLWVHIRYFSLHVESGGLAVQPVRNTLSDRRSLLEFTHDCNLCNDKTLSSGATRVAKVGVAQRLVCRVNSSIESQITVGLCFYPL